MAVLEAVADPEGKAVMAKLGMVVLPSPHSALVAQLRLRTPCFQLQRLVLRVRVLAGPASPAHPLPSRAASRDSPSVLADFAAHALRLTRASTRSPPTNLLSLLHRCR